MTRAEVDCGGCGFRAVVRATSSADGRVALQVESDCPAVCRLVEQLGSVDPLDGARTFLTSPVYRAAEACLKHADCLAPVAIIRAIAVEAGMALPHEGSLRLARE